MRVARGDGLNGAGDARPAKLSLWLAAPLSLSLGAVAILGLQPFAIWPLFFVSLSGLVWLLDRLASERTDRRERLRAFALVGWSYAFGYHLTGLHWIGAAFLVEAEQFGWLLPFAITLLPAGLSLFMAAAVALVGMIWQPGTVSRILAFAVAVSIFELARSSVLTGFPWNTLGYWLTMEPALAQSVSLVGVEGLLPLAVLVFSLPALLFSPFAPGRSAAIGARFLAGIVLLGLACAWTWGAARLASAPALATGNSSGAPLLRLVQPSIPQREKWKPGNARPIFDLLKSLSRNRSDGRTDDMAAVTHLVWPESVFPFEVLRDRVALEEIAALLAPDRHLVAGALRIERPGEVGGAVADPYALNSILVLDDAGRLATRPYDKNRLVPFGEFLPLKGVLSALGLRALVRQRAGFASGATSPRLDVPGLPPAVALICYEAIFPQAAFPASLATGGEAAVRPGWLLNVTNDAWFGRSIGPHQHLHHARVRALEQGLPLVRVANNGITALVDPFGRIVSRLELDHRGTLDVVLPPPLAPTPFSRFGRNAVFVLLLLLCATTWLALPVRGMDEPTRLA
ncbi:MAG: apolipoprotein N-acyltransferase [Rhizobiales bacterium]|nr:apolipoprotein N-acyltransferase [Hyphomicrobiales bacterium]